MGMQQIPDIGKSNPSNSQTDSDSSSYSSNQDNTDINLDRSLDGYDYNLPPDLIAQNPAVPQR